MDLDTALAYTGVSEKQLRQWERDGQVLFLPKGPFGKRITRRAALDAALDHLFERADPLENWDFDD